MVLKLHYFETICSWTSSILSPSNLDNDFQSQRPLKRARRRLGASSHSWHYGIRSQQHLCSLVHGRCRILHVSPSRSLPRVRRIILCNPIGCTAWHAFKRFFTSNRIVKISSLYELWWISSYRIFYLNWWFSTGLHNVVSREPRSCTFVELNYDRKDRRQRTSSLHNPRWLLLPHRELWRHHGSSSRKLVNFTARVSYPPRVLCSRI